MYLLRRGQLLGRRLNGADDLVVAGAAAEIAGELETDLVLAGIGVLVEQGLSRHQKARRANAALERGPFEEALLERVQVPWLGEAFDRLDPCSLGFNRQDNAAIDRDAAEHDRTGAAVAVVAAFFGAGEAQGLAEDFQQALPRLAEKLGGFAVDSRRDVDFFHGSSDEW